MDGHNFPNLALMRISSYHKARGDEVEWWWSDFIHYDIVYMSKIFSDAYSQDIPEPLNADKVVKGGTGYAIKTVDGKEFFDKEKDFDLPEEIEKMFPFTDEDATWLEGYNLTDSVEGEIRLVTMDIDVSIHGQELHLLTDEQKNVIAIATADDLAPLQGEFASSAYMAFYLRTSSQGEKYIVVKDGFSVRAAIMQPDVKEALRDSLLEALTLLRVEGLKDGTVDITRQCWPTGGNEETEADDEET